MCEQKKQERARSRRSRERPAPEKRTEAQPPRTPAWCTSCTQRGARRRVRDPAPRRAQLQGPCGLAECLRGLWRCGRTGQYRRGHNTHRRGCPSRCRPSSSGACLRTPLLASACDRVRFAAWSARSIALPDTPADGPVPSHVTWNFLSLSQKILNFFPRFVKISKGLLFRNDLCFCCMRCSEQHSSVKRRGGERRERGEREKETEEGKENQENERGGREKRERRERESLRIFILGTVSLAGLCRGDSASTAQEMQMSENELPWANAEENEAGGAAGAARQRPAGPIQHEGPRRRARGAARGADASSSGDSEDDPSEVRIAIPGRRFRRYARLPDKTSDWNDDLFSIGMYLLAVGARTRVAVGECGARAGCAAAGRGQLRCASLRCTCVCVRARARLCVCVCVSVSVCACVSSVSVSVSVHVVRACALSRAHALFLPLHRFARCVLWTHVRRSLCLRGNSS